MVSSISKFILFFFKVFSIYDLNLLPCIVYSYSTSMVRQHQKGSIKYFSYFTYICSLLSAMTTDLWDVVTETERYDHRIRVISHWLRRYRLIIFSSYIKHGSSTQYSFFFAGSKYISTKNKKAGFSLVFAPIYEKGCRGRNKSEYDR